MQQHAASHECCTRVVVYPGVVWLVAQLPLLLLGAAGVAFNLQIRLVVALWLQLRALWRSCGDPFGRRANYCGVLV
eukprot:8897464-Alexandrium_andersonii.AAC.1